MIERLTIKNKVDVINFLLEFNDRFEDFYFTIDKPPIINFQGFFAR